MKPKCCIDNKTLKEVRQTAEFLKIIAEENRLKILCTLKAGERCVCDIWQDLNIPQNLASHHLKILKAVNYETLFPLNSHVTKNNPRKQDFIETYFVTQLKRGIG